MKKYRLPNGGLYFFWNNKDRINTLVILNKTSYNMANIQNGSCFRGAFVL